MQPFTLLIKPSGSDCNVDCKYCFYKCRSPEVGRGNPVLAFALSMGHLLNSSLGLPLPYGTVFGILTVEGFLITTLDSAVRLNPSGVSELPGSG